MDGGVWENGWCRRMISSRDEPQCVGGDSEDGCFPGLISTWNEPQCPGGDRICVVGWYP